MANFEREWNGTVYLFAILSAWLHEHYNEAAEFFSPRRVSTSRYLVTLAGRRNRIRIIAEQHSTAQQKEEEEEKDEEAAYCRSVTDQSESPRHDSRRSLACSRVRLSSKRSLRRRDIGHNSNGSEIVVNAFAPPGQSAILTQLRYESDTFFLHLLLSSFSLQKARLLPSSRSGTRSFSLLFRFDERRVRVRFRPDYWPTTSRHLGVLVVAKGPSRCFSGLFLSPRCDTLSLSMILDLYREHTLFIFVLSIILSIIL